jgi:AcrR family transcriptional regulator
MSSQTPKAPRARAPRGTLSRTLIVEAAAKLIDDEGLAALTIRRLADELGVRPMSLYTHFRDKEAILAAVANDLRSRFDWPEAGYDDVEWLRQAMRAYFRLLTDYPALLQMDAIGHSTNKTEAQLSEQVYTRLVNLKMDHRQAIGLVATLVRFVLGCALLYPARHAWDEDPHHWERVRQQVAHLPAEAYPTMHELSTDFPTFTQFEVFEIGLDLILAQLAT